MLLGFSLSTIYMTILVVIGCITVLYLFFADIADGAAEAVPFFDLALILPFITITAAAGYIFEKFSSISALIILIIAMFISIIVTTALYFFLLIPLRSAEVSLTYTEQSLEGQTAKVIVPIPLDGFGEIVIESVNGVISKRAASFQNIEIPYDAEVLIIEVKESTAYVTLYEQNSLFQTS